MKLRLNIEEQGAEYGINPTDMDRQLNVFCLYDPHKRQEIIASAKKIMRFTPIFAPWYFVSKYYSLDSNLKVFIASYLKIRNLDEIRDDAPFHTKEIQTIIQLIDLLTYLEFSQESMQEI